MVSFNRGNTPQHGYNAGGWNNEAFQQKKYIQECRNRAMAFADSPEEKEVINNVYNRMHELWFGKDQEFGTRGQGAMLQQVMEQTKLVEAEQARPPSKKQPEFMAGAYHPVVEDAE